MGGSLPEPPEGAIRHDDNRVLRTKCRRRPGCTDADHERIKSAARVFAVWSDRSRERDEPHSLACNHYGRFGVPRSVPHGAGYLCSSSTSLEVPMGAEQTSNAMGAPKVEIGGGGGGSHVVACSAIPSLRSPNTG